ncbi:MAG TPA: DUF6515 family protein [Lacunisphaera sp.]|nr:DUF6515 family protein [Lacunisphaera sp.]
MSADSLSPGSWNLLSRAGLTAAVLAVTALGTAPAVRASDVRVGVSVGLELPHGYAEVRVGRDRYFEHRGVFYRHGPHGYVVVRAPRGAVLRTLPPYYTRIYVGNVMYYRYGDVYYQPVRDGYVVVDPPAATPLPPVRPVEEYKSVYVGQAEYLFKDGQFFIKTPDGMVWVKAPIGAVTADLPPDAKSVWYQDIEYFDCDDVYFRKTPQGYKVVEAPWKQ